MLAVVHDLLAPDIVVAPVEGLLFALAFIRSMDDFDVPEVGEPETPRAMLDDLFNLQCLAA